MILRSFLAILACTLLAEWLPAQNISVPITQAHPEQLRLWLRQYPAADVNRDGQLTVEEAEAFRCKFQGPRGPAKPTFRHDYTFATVSDGVRIALAVGYPKGFDPADRQRKWPVVFSTCGYPTVVVPAAPSGYGDRYVTVNASIRGSGASGGALAPFQPRTWQDGYEIIENWIVKQPWSNGKVAIQGYSWPGLMGFLTASTQPPSLKAVSVGGLLDDFYRGIARPGGISNCGFPIDWLINFYRPDGVFGSDAAAMEARKLDPAAFARIVASRPARDWTQDVLWMGLHEVFDGPRWHASNLATQAAKIRAPIMIAHAWQDEQTGPTGWQLWRLVPDTVPKRLVLGNGNHAASPVDPAQTRAWFDHWLLDAPDAELADPARRVACYFETRAESNGRGGVRGQPLAASDFPFPDTQWKRLFLRADRRLTPTASDAGEADGEYHVGHDDLGAAGRVEYELELPQITAIGGPALLTLWAQLSTLDTDFYVLLADRAPNGTLVGLQRGLLRASHRAVDPERSRWVHVDGQRTLLQPFHPHTSVEPVAPHQPCRFEIEIPAVGHVFRPGHKLVLCITRPPAGDPIGTTRSGAPSYRYDSHPPPGAVKILHDAQHPSSLLLPVLAKLPPLEDPPAPPAEQAGLQPVR